MKVSDLAPDYAVLVCDHVLNEQREVRMVIFDEEGLQAVCELQHDHDAAEGGAGFTALKTLLSLHNELDFVKDLEMGQLAWKTGPNSWEIEAILG